MFSNNLIELGLKIISAVSVTCSCIVIIYTSYT